MQSFPQQVGNPLAKMVSIRPVFLRLLAAKLASLLSSCSQQSGSEPFPTARSHSRDKQELRQADSCSHGLCAEAQPVQGDRRGAAVPAAFLGSLEEPE